MNLGFGDSASQVKNEIDTSLDGGIPNINDLKNRPFASNMENAKILAKLTRHRIQKLGINDSAGQEFSLIMSQISEDLKPERQQQEYEKQNKINKYLTGTLKHLNLTIDILIDQYDPVKIKNI